MVKTQLSIIRKKRQLTMKEVAKALDISLSAYQKYENGTRDVSTTMLSKIADFYNVTTDYLLGRDTKEPKPIEQFAKQFNLSADEENFIDNFLSLAPDERDILINAMRKIVR